MAGPIPHTSLSNVTSSGSATTANFLNTLRDKKTTHARYRRAMEILGEKLIYEMLDRTQTHEIQIDTAVAEAVKVSVLKFKTVAMVRVLGAGEGFAAGISKIFELFFEVEDLLLAMHRDETNPENPTPVTDYERKLANSAEMDFTVLCEPMIATGLSCIEAVTKLKKEGAKNIHIVSVIASEEGLAELCEAHPDVVIHAAAIDKELNLYKYIIPGLGDAGDNFLNRRKIAA